MDIARINNEKKPSEYLNQQFNTIKTMYSGSLLIETIEPICQNNLFTFTNDVPIYEERSPMSAKYFNNCKQYLAMFKNRSYHFLFIDGSLAKFHYEFDEEYKLLSYNLLWYPCPFSKEFLKIFIEDDGTINKMDLYDYIDNIEEIDNFKYMDFNLCSPIRVDYDYTYASVGEK